MKKKKKKKPSRLANQIADLYDEQCVFKCERPVRIERTYASRNQRSLGAWSWYLLDSSVVGLKVGSCHSASEIIRRKSEVKMILNTNIASLEFIFSEAKG